MLVREPDLPGSQGPDQPLPFRSGIIELVEEDGRVTGDEAADALVTALARQSKWRGGVVTVREILVMSSELTREGPVYSVMSRAKLLGDASPATD